MTTAQTAFNELTAIKAPVNHLGQGWGGRALFSISAECNLDPKYGDQIWADYWEAPAGYAFGVNPAIDEILNKHGLSCEWVNPGVLDVYEV